ncbi:MAG: NAD-dependent epimerase/dehydratase family protein [Actinomycetota bacterium]
MTASVLVTGGAGFIGANLVRRLESDGAVGRVRVLDDLSTGRPANLAGTSADLVEGSIVDPAVVDRVAADADAIVHLAARPSVPRSLVEPVASHTANATGTINVLEASRAARGGPVPVVVASSSSVYGANPTLPKHEDLAPAPLSPYAASKLAAESEALAWQAAFGVPVLALRFFNVYGPLQAADHDYAAVVPRFVDAALAGRPVTVHGDGRQTRDFTFVDSVTEVLARAALGPVTAAKPVNLAFGTRTDLLSVLELIEAALGRTVEREHVESRPADVRHSQADGAALRHLFPDLDPVGLEVGIGRTIDWMRSIR